MSISEFLDGKQDFSSLPWGDQIKYMAYFYTKINGVAEFMPADIDALCSQGRVASSPNTSAYFNRLVTKGIFIPVGRKYAIQRDELFKLDTEFSLNTPKAKVAQSLRDLVPKVQGETNQIFLQEAIKCYEVNARRAAIIMAWLLTIDHLYEYIMQNKLQAFNDALRTQYPKQKTISSKDDFSNLKESVFIEVCKLSGVISKDVGKLLEEKLGFRNSVAHPNTLVISESKATSFIEDLIENVILKY